MPLFLSARIAAALLCVLILVVPVACTSATDAPPPRPPEETSADLASRLELVFEVSRSGRYDPRALLVEVGGRPVLQEGDMSTPVEVDEVAASVVGMLVGIALAEGDLPGLSATLDELLPGYVPVMSPAVRQVTLEQLLTMTAGLVDDVSTRGVLPGPEQDWVASALTTGPQRPPGSGFAASRATSHVLAAVLAEGTGRPVAEYAREKLFGPLGIPAGGPGERGGWGSDPQGRTLGFGGLVLAPEDLAALGRLWLDGGVRAGERLVPAEWMRIATAPRVVTDKWMPYFGLHMWATRVADHPAFAAAGTGGHLVEVVPALDLVVVVASNPAFVPPADGQAYAEIVSSVIVPALG